MFEFVGKGGRRPPKSSAAEAIVEAEVYLVSVLLELEYDLNALSLSGNVENIFLLLANAYSLSSQCNLEVKIT